MTPPSGPRGDVPVLGMVGAGQLARMTHQAVVGLAVDLRILADGPTDSAALVSPDVTVGSWHSLDDLETFASGCDVVTFDHELVDPAHLAELERRGHVLRPSPAAERFAQDKRYQRDELAAAGFPVPQHRAVETLDDLIAFGDGAAWPVVVKAARGGYDGRGVWVVDDRAAAQDLWAETREGGVDLLVEAHVPILRELAVAVVRRPSGEERAYAVTETVQSDGICVELTVPAPVPEDLTAQATDLALRLVEHVGGTGVVAVEMFQTAEGLLVNELALRPHNSVHWTIEGARTSQFQNHARAVLDLPLGDTAMTAPAVATVNILGPADGSDPRTRLGTALEVPGVAVHLYGKGARPGRKLGHVTAVGVVMGSDSDLDVMDAAVDVLSRFEVAHEVRVVSAHRRPHEMLEYGRSAVERGLQVIIAGAGGAAHLPGMLASTTSVPVIGVPVPLRHLDGLDSLLSIVQMPRGVPVATVSVGGGENAGLLAVRILATSDEDLRGRLDEHREEIAEKSRQADDKVSGRGERSIGFRTR